MPVSDSAYLYGLGIFETLRSIGENILFIKEHLARMERNAKLLGLALPFSKKKIGDEIAKTVRTNKLKEAMIRVTLSESESGKPNLVIVARPFEPYPKECYDKGGKMVVIRSAKNSATEVASIKTTNYLPKILGRREIEKRGAVEGALLNANGMVSEGASSNIFIVRGGRIATPPLSEGLLPGTRRRAVIDLAHKLGIPIDELPLKLNELQEADEIFVTSTLKDVLPIGSFEGRKVGKAAPGPVTAKLMHVYRERFLTSRPRF